MRLPSYSVLRANDLPIAAVRSASLLLVAGVIGATYLVGRADGKFDARAATAEATKCPAVARNARLADVEEVVRAARARATRTFRLVNQLGNVTLNRRNARVIRVLWLGRGASGLLGVRSLTRRAEARCGPRVARASWAVTFVLAEAPTAFTSRGTMLLVRTHAGWHAWMHQFG